MKKLLFIFLMILTLTSAQSQEQNYTRKTTYKDSTATLSIVETTYFDGLGRPIQQIAHGQSSTGKDIVTHIAYDAFGRQTKEFLPYVNGTSSLNYNTDAANDVLQYYSGSEYENTLNPYSEKELEFSPLNRVFKQAAPGNVWALGSGHEIKMEYETNTDDGDAKGSVKKYRATASWNATAGLYNVTLDNNNGFYPANKLYKTITKDENWVAGTRNNTVEEYKNKDGQVVLKRTFLENEPLDTYYVYDQFGNLSYVLPPLAEGNYDENTLNYLCYQYKYDYRNRLVEKKLPGKQWEFIVYNTMDMPVATGPALSPWGGGDNAGWLITKYDAFGRAVYTGWFKVIPANATGRKTFQDNHNNVYDGWCEIEQLTTIDAVEVGYTNKCYPTSGYSVLTANYYDNYDFPNAQTLPATLPDSTYPIAQIVKGLATGSWVRFLDSNENITGITSTIFYDTKFRPVRTHTANHLGGYTQTDSNLDFMGKVNYTVIGHERASGEEEIFIKDTFTYSAEDRLLLHTQEMNETDYIVEQLIVSNTYDELGQLKSKNVGGDDLSGATGLQNVDYTYNIRGWLKEINKPPDMSQIQPQDFFNFKISYENPTTVAPLYNGNISETFWKTNNDNKWRKYSYQYDALNRLLTASYEKPELAFSQGNYNEYLSYDKNGNIQSLYRTGNRDSEGLVGENVIDNLLYTYDKDKRNQLLKVFDDTNNPQGFTDDSDGITDIEADYSYDDNGNMISDANKGIESIIYNHLNLPTEINFASGKTIHYIYDALGQKVTKIAPENVGGIVGYADKTTDYLNGFQYKNGMLLFFPHAEGYVNHIAFSLGTQLDGSGMTLESYNYVFNYTDHLGNVRLSYGVDPKTFTLKIMEENHYYPFGLKHTNYNSDYLTFGKSDTGGVSLRRPPVGGGVPKPIEYKYKFLGQERQEELGLNWDTFRYRNYDYAIGRFMGIDPVSEDYTSITTYQFAHNNPVWKIEIEGLEGQVTTGRDVLNDEPNVFDKGMIWATDYIFETADILTGGKENNYLTTVNPIQALKNIEELANRAESATDDIIKSGQDFLNDPGGAIESIGKGLIDSVEDLMSGDAKKTANAVIVLAPMFIVPEASAEGTMSKLEARAAKLSEKPRPGQPVTKAGKQVTVELNKAKNGGKTICETCNKETIPAQRDKRGISPPRDRTEIDHIKKKRDGGSGTPDNTRVRCRGCNNADR